LRGQGGRLTQSHFIEDEDGRAEERGVAGLGTGGVQEKRNADEEEHEMRRVEICKKEEERKIRRGEVRRLWMASAKPIREKKYRGKTKESKGSGGN